MKDAREAVQKKVDVSDNVGWSFSSSGATMTWSLNGSTQRSLAESATDQAMKIIDSRINAVGVTEPTLGRHGGQNSHQILLQMPGIQDPSALRSCSWARHISNWFMLISPPSPIVGADLFFAGRGDGLAQQWWQSSRESARVALRGARGFDFDGR